MDADSSVDESSGISEPHVTPSPTEVVTHMGLFWWTGPMCPKKACRLQKIQEYFTEERLRTLLLPVITKEGKLSLRALDWLVTNYAKKVPIVYNIKPVECPEVVLNVYNSYKNWLWNHKRKNFDPFRRGQRIFFTVDGVSYESTVGQLNFFFWASRYGVLQYAQEHIGEIEKDQAVSTKSHQDASKEGLKERAKEGGTKRAYRESKKEEGAAGRKRKRRQLSQAPRESVFVYPTTITVVFNPPGSG